MPVCGFSSPETREYHLGDNQQLGLLSWDSICIMSVENASNTAVIELYSIQVKCSVLYFLVFHHQKNNKVSRLGSQWQFCASFRRQTSTKCHSNVIAIFTQKAKFTIARFTKPLVNFISLEVYASVLLLARRFQFLTEGGCHRQLFSRAQHPHVVFL